MTRLRNSNCGKSKKTPISSKKLSPKKPMKKMLLVRTP